jgi:mRNA interferase MazF
MEVKRMQVWYADLSPVKGCEQGGHRAVVVISNDKGNAVSPISIVAPITSKIGKKRLPTQVIIGSYQGTLVDSMIMCEQIKTIDKSRLMKLLFEITEPSLIAAIDKAIKVSLGI